MTKTQTCPDAVLAKLERLEIVGSVAMRYPDPLERAEYTAMNKVLEALGGKWNRKANGHLFPSDPVPLIQHVLETGTFLDAKKAYGFFETPPGLAIRMVKLAGIDEGMRVLEPSAGRGMLAIAARQAGGDVTCVELQPEHAHHLRVALDFETRCDDFLAVARERKPHFERVVMNPPFAGQADIDHVLAAFSLLVSGGKLVSVMSAGVSFRQNLKSMQFRSHLDIQAMDALPDGTFKDAGTQVRTVLVTMEKRA